MVTVTVAAMMTATTAVAVATTTTTMVAVATAKVVGTDNNQLKAAAKETAVTGDGNNDGDRNSNQLKAAADLTFSPRSLRKTSQIK